MNILKLSKTEVSHLLAQKKISEISQEIKDYTKLDLNIEDFFEKFLSHNQEYPIQTLAQSNYCHYYNSSFLTIPTALYGLYGKCGQGLIPDTDFKPQQDNIIAEYCQDIAIFLLAPLNIATILIGSFTLYKELLD
jgi:hypothetical protein